MAVISVVGAPGSGKSFLTKQLATYHCCPSFFEGEMGVFTKDVLDAINNPVDTPKRYDWFLERIEKTLSRAHKISSIGIDCYVDGDFTSIEAWHDAEIGDKSPPILKKWLNKNENLKAHKVILLTITESELRDSIKKRGRESEQSIFIIERAIRIQRAFIKLSKKYTNFLVIDRTDIDFTHEKTLKSLIDRLANLP